MSATANRKRRRAMAEAAERLRRERADAQRVRYERIERRNAEIAKAREHLQNAAHGTDDLEPEDNALLSLFLHWTADPYWCWEAIAESVIKHVVKDEDAKALQHMQAGKYSDMNRAIRRAVRFDNARRLLAEE